MGKIILGMTMSLDGFINEPRRQCGQPLSRFR